MDEDDDGSLARFFCPCVFIAENIQRTLAQQQPMLAAVSGEEDVSQEVNTWYSAKEMKSPESQSSKQPITGHTGDSVCSTAAICNRTNSCGGPCTDECVMCLDEFSLENPPMRTLCSCGENRTKFHYPCLLLWLEKRSTCPNCSSHLFYEENVEVISGLLTETEDTVTESAGKKG